MFQLFLLATAMVADGLSLARAETLDSVRGSIWTQEALYRLKVWQMEQALHCFMCCSSANIPGAETVFSNKLPRKHNFSNTSKVNIQHQSNISTSVQKMKKRSKAIFLQLLMEVTLLHYLFPPANHWSKEDDSVVGFWMSYQKPRHDWDSETGSSQQVMKSYFKISDLYPFWG